MIINNKKYKIDEIREKLKINELDESTKKQIFNKFIEAGGKVISLEDDHRNNLNKKILDNKLRKGFSGKTSCAPKTIKMEKNEEKIIKEIEDSINNKYIKNPFSKWLEKLSIKLDCFFNSISNLRVTEFNKKFINFILFDFQNTLLNTKMILASVLYQNINISNEIKNKLNSDSKFPFYYEILYRFDNIYNQELFNNLNVMKKKVNSIEEAKPFLKILFKSIYILKPYADSIKVAVERALIYEKDIRRLEKNIAYLNIRKLYNYIDFVFNKVYQKLFILIYYFYKIELLDYNKNISFLDFLEIKDDEQIGFLTQKWKEELEKALKEEEKKKKETEKEDKELSNNSNEDKNNPLIIGLKLIEKYIDFNKILETYTTEKDPRLLFSINDKVFFTYVFLDYFDKEFSFLFNSNKVNYNIIFDFGTRLDIRKELQDIYYKINNVFERISEYLKVLRDIKKIEKDEFMTLGEKNSLNNQYLIQRSQISKIIRKDAREIMEEFYKKFSYLLTDYKESRSVIQNPDDILEFDIKIGGERIAQGKKVIDFIEEAYYYTYAVQFLLIDGDLGGFSPVIENFNYLKIKSNT